MALRTRFEGPTWAALVGCYTVWSLCLWQAGQTSWWFLIACAFAVALHSSLTHEVLHGHPTRNRLVNEATVFLALGLFIPYRRFRDLHLRHHNDERLTDPFDDPESFYTPLSAWGRWAFARRTVLQANGTLLGRMILGPPLSLWAFWRTDLSAMRSDPSIRGAWIRHILGLIPVLVAVAAAGVPIWIYVLCVAYPGMSLIMVRSFIEHRATENTDERTAVIEAHWFWCFLFLNNNFHSVHHDRPALAWYLIPAVWRRERNQVLDRNGGYYLPGYGEVFRRWALRRREPVVHPLLHRTGIDAGRDG
ncbi:MAG: fatty acid desaturase [Pseudomonadota bacterium]